MAIGRRLQNHPKALLWAYRLARGSLARVAGVSARIGHERVEAWIRGPEQVAKRFVFDCRMCGQCVLHETGMTCPMTCPKSLRNGPCGGVRPDGGCEVVPAARCIWVEADMRARSMGAGSDLSRLQPPIDHRLEGTSAWGNLLSGSDRCRPPGWGAASDGPEESR
jgi:hypothetical protein